MMAEEYVAKIEGAFDDPGALSSIEASLREDDQLDAFSRDVLLSRIGQYRLDRAHAERASRLAAARAEIETGTYNPNLDEDDARP